MKVESKLHFDQRDISDVQAGTGLGLEEIIEATVATLQVECPEQNCELQAVVNARREFIESDLSTPERQYGRDVAWVECAIRCVKACTQSDMHLRALQAVGGIHEQVVTLREACDAAEQSVNESFAETLAGLEESRRQADVALAETVAQKDEQVTQARQNLIKNYRNKLGL